MAKAAGVSDPTAAKLHGPHPVNASALRRLRSIEGQVRGVARMIEEEEYCVDILTQIAAARSALNRVAMMILKRHIETCVSNAIKSGGKAQQEVIDELVEALSRNRL